jgi:trans-AT polyketide synthase, acyltransferase and oxidoreductase domains
MNAEKWSHTTGLWWDKGTGGRIEPFDVGPGSSIYNITEPVVVVGTAGGYGQARGGVIVSSGKTGPSGAQPVAGMALPCPITALGDPEFCSDHGLRYPYIAGSMANGISSVAMVKAMADNGMLGFFGAGGLTLTEIEAAMDRLRDGPGERPFGFNLIHSPTEPALEKATVDLYIKKKVRLIEASAYMDLTPALVRYCLKDVYRDSRGRVQTPNRIIAKASRTEVASKFFSPPSESILRTLVGDGSITDEQANMAQEIPVARDLTAEADSGGHTDNQSAMTLLPTMMALRDRLMAHYTYDRPLRVGAAGGIATPMSTLAAFTMGAAYVMTGSVNQSAAEAGTSDLVRGMLAKAGQADITMAPSADMFEMGVKVQVLKWGTMFAMRAARLYELYKSRDHLGCLSTDEREQLEKHYFQADLDDIWAQTRDYFLKRDPEQVARAEKNPKHRMALVFRWYLGQAAGWAIRGEAPRKIDFQVYCGPAMGAFNEWVKDSFLESADNRDVVTIAFNLLFGSAVLTRLSSLRIQGIYDNTCDGVVRPLGLEQIKEYLS